ncbi:uncharacterized protein LOC108231221 [Kryptolebias marmoratus]|uniref:uncharacterized protein LOC108231221 n=1 Tax=Kryptolebias marmoratus TaxID=37003 RepID=UPI0007F8D2F2|nr:uncharacterized protein LOC108231221 [Kryptolebias marmoratus]XP_017263630.1 uncharacterized protein LOC108231221 [Kryptolebias marmoratus]XP_024860016.2 uncharacterized protein LOC108231221 [Kryptolebias marmoratus]
MPPKRNCGTRSPAEPQVKMIKIGGDSDVQDFPSGSMEDRFRMAEESSPSPLPNNEAEIIDFDEENFATSGIRTDTISLLMKIDQLQAQLKYERRCRILAERELRELREMNTLMLQMRHTAHELRVTLDHVLNGGEAAVTSQNPEEVVTFLPEPEVQMRTVDNIPEDDPNFIYLSESLRVPKNLYERIAEIADYKKYISALLMILFDRDTLATHCLQGRKNSLIGEESHKPALPPEILKGLMDHVAAKFGVDGNLIKTAIRTKLNNEDKLMKKRLGLNRADSRAAVDQTFCQDASLLTKSETMANDSEF